MPIKPLTCICLRCREVCRFKLTCLSLNSVWLLSDLQVAALAVMTDCVASPGLRTLEMYVQLFQNKMSAGRIEVGLAPIGPLRCMPSITMKSGSTAGANLLICV